VGAATLAVEQKPIKNRHKSEIGGEESRKKPRTFAGRSVEAAGAAWCAISDVIGAVLLLAAALTVFAAVISICLIRRARGAGDGDYPFETGVD
jgi:hypothetical protein